jgi:hypothetical protein
MVFIGKGGCSGMEEEIKHLLLFFFLADNEKNTR